MKKNVLITGGTSGIGLATARVFSHHGCSVVITGRRQERLDDIRTQLDRGASTEVGTLCYDVREPHACQHAVERLQDKGWLPDILINNAGLARGLHPVHDGELTHWEEMIDTNIKGLLYMSRLIAPLMVKQGHGHLINISSVAGKEAYPMGNVYCATKHAVDALTRAMRIDLHQHGVRVSQISPGAVEETEFASVRFEGDAEKARIYDDYNPLTARDVAETIYFIASRPPHVNILDIDLAGTQQASATIIDRSGRKYD